MRNEFNRRIWLRATTSLLIAGIFCASALTRSEAAKPLDKSANAININPIVTSLTVENGKLTAHGTASAVINGKAVTTPFTAPVNISVAGPAVAVVGCPVLNLSLGPIHLDLLGLVVDTSAICLDITAIPGGGLLGDLLCNLATLLQSNTLEQILSGAPLVDLTGVPVAAINVNELTTRLSRLLNGVLVNLLQAVLADILPNPAGTCQILNLELGPLNLTLLGLNVYLHDCENGSVTVDITGQDGLLGDLLCGLLGGQLSPTLGGIINQLLLLLAR